MLKKFEEFFDDVKRIYGLDLKSLVSEDYKQKRKYITLDTHCSAIISCNVQRLLRRLESSGYIAIQPNGYKRTAIEILKTFR